LPYATTERVTSALPFGTRAPPFATCRHANVRPTQPRDASVTCRYAKARSASEVTTTAAAIAEGAPHWPADMWALVGAPFGVGEILRPVFRLIASASCFGG